MKRIILTAIIAMATICASAQDNKSYQLKGKSFVSQQAKKKPSSTYTPTTYTWDGDTIYLHAITKGENAGKTFAYVRKVSKKTLKPYWKKLPESVVADIKK